ncbi:MAG: triose-phosphate isomerase [Nitriliruptoraceae bacterium]
MTSTDQRRTPLIVGNWKMYRDHLEAIQLVQKLAYHLQEEDYEDQEVVVCPPFVALRSIQTLIQSDKLPLRLGAQNCFDQDEGAYTGEVSAPMLARLDVAYVLAGHSERRSVFGETDAVVKAKTDAIVRHGMKAIVCVGEGADDRDAGRADEVVLAQMKGSLAGFDVGDADELVIAYEPVWAIGTGRTATPDDAQSMAATIRGALTEQFGEVAGSMRVLYGGSVKPGNIAALMAATDVDGVLVGGASLLAEDFALIVSHRR